MGPTVLGWPRLCASCSHWGVRLGFAELVVTGPRRLGFAELVEALLRVLDLG